MAVPVTLQVFKGDKLIATREFNRDMIKIGRLASAHLSLDDEKVSRIHSVIECNENGSMSITDMGGVEGTFVNGKRVNKGQIQIGDEIRLGNTVIRVCAQNLAQAPAPEAAAAQRTQADVASALAQAASPVVQAAPVPAAQAAPVAVAPAPYVAPVPASYVAPAPAPRAAPAPASAPVQSAPAEPLAPGDVLAARARRKKKGTGPLGLELRILWGDTIVAEHLLRPGALPPFTVGTANDASFAMGDSKLGSAKFTVVTRDANGFKLHFNGKMKGELTRKGESFQLGHLIESGKAQSEGDSYAIALQQEDFGWVELGGVTLEVCFQSLPKPVVVPFFESMDFTVLNIFLVLFFLGSLFVITAKNQQTEGDPFADDLSNPESRIAKLIIKPPEVQKNPLIEKLAQQKAEKSEARKASQETVAKRENKPTTKTAPKVPTNKDQAKALTQKIFGGKGGVSTLFGSGGLGGELKSAMGGMFGSASNSNSFGLKGESGGGGGGGSTIGIGAVGTKGRGGGTGSYGEGTGTLTGKKGVDIGITASEPEVQGSLDKELIRQVIKRNRDAIKFCYSSQLQRFPNLAGKVGVKFVISGEGRVISSNISQTTVNNAEMETCISGRVRTWQFPKPKGGGVVVVTYPFVFSSGE